jgi:hypothetical protein
MEPVRKLLLGQALFDPQTAQRHSKGNGHGILRTFLLFL